MEVGPRDLAEGNVTAGDPPRPGQGDGPAARRPPRRPRRPWPRWPRTCCAEARRRSGRPHGRGGRRSTRRSRRGHRVRPAAVVGASGPRARTAWPPTPSASAACSGPTAPWPADGDDDDAGGRGRPRVLSGCRPSGRSRRRTRLGAAGIAIIRTAVRSVSRTSWKRGLPPTLSFWRRGPGGRAGRVRGRASAGLTEGAKRRRRRVGEEVTAVAEALHDVLSPLLADRGLELVDLEVRAGTRPGDRRPRRGRRPRRPRRGQPGRLRGARRPRPVPGPLHARGVEPRASSAACGPRRTSPGPSARRCRCGPGRGPGERRRSQGRAGGGRRRRLRPRGPRRPGRRAPPRLRRRSSGPGRCSSGAATPARAPPGAPARSPASRDRAHEDATERVTTP